MDSVRLRRRHCSAAVAALVGFVCLASATSLRAQTTSAFVSGSVQDSKEASCPGPP